MKVVLRRLKHILAQRQKSYISDASRIRSAVLVPIYNRQDEYHILFTQRTETVRDHKGQISFPGGVYEEQDKTLLNTALRECVEEIGLEIEAVELLGELDDFITATSNYIITPFVAAIPWPHTLRPDPREVEEIIKVPLSALLDRDCRHEETEVIDGVESTAYTYHYRGKVIWGATANILKQFLDIWNQVVNDTST
jgi:8-oxo-dGTP pyrophosphatase MutT (NUDIX family)